MVASPGTGASLTVCGKVRPPGYARKCSGDLKVSANLYT